MREGLDKEFDFGIKFKGVEPNLIDPPEKLDYVLYPTMYYRSNLSDVIPSIFQPEAYYRTDPIYKMQKAIEEAFLQAKNDAEVTNYLSGTS